jgi:hypothetical protein
VGLGAADLGAGAGLGAGAAGLGASCRLGAALGEASGACPADWIVDVARSLQTTGFALPVAAKAVNASSTVAAPASAIGARRHGLNGALAIA